ncbi:unnamed protein product [Bemisia tabaci]|uniref:Uncharacterized protein n=1 Tax=Bemisia tabaci TaxID=7038 RepID=A0A9P0A9J0_BEMTA|nr:unnamed protein product [Bemisia tabaci]
MFAVPKALSYVIIGLGLTTGQQSALRLVPNPETTPDEAADRLQTVVTHAVDIAFSRLVNACASGNLIQTGYVTSQETGAAWCMLSARQAFDVANIANQSENVKVVSTFPE